MSALLLLLVLLTVILTLPDAEAAPLWGRWGETFTASGDAPPDTELTVDMTAPSGKKRTIAGFWDGERTWRVRFQPTEEGTWRYRTHAAPKAAGLDNRSGTFICRRVAGDNPFSRHGPVRVSGDGHYLQHQDGTPFFWLGDTVWNGPLLSTAEDWDAYLTDRTGKGFSVVQFNTLAPWRTAPTDAEGDVAFTGRDPVRINPRFFQRLDARMDAINAAGMLAAPVLLWSLTDRDPGKYLSEEDCIRLARYQVARYGAHQVVWILAGDNPYTGESAEKWKRVGRAVFGENRHPAPVATHPTGMNWPWESWRDEAWLDILGYQSGHGDDAGTLRWLHSGPPAQHGRKTPARPVINLEPPYEAHVAYQSKKPHSAYSVRRAAYWSLLSAPTAGLTYGGHGLWSWHTRPGEEPTDHSGTGVAPTWREALSLPGSRQMEHVADLFRQLPWWKLRPASDTVLVNQPHAEDPARHVAAARTEDGAVTVLYLPAETGVVTVKADVPTGGARWLDPRTGMTSAARAERSRFHTPTNEDWVLLLRR